jgi:hypothetical protein
MKTILFLFDLNSPSHAGAFCALLVLAYLAAVWLAVKLPRTLRLWRKLQTAPFRFGARQKLTIVCNSMLPEWMNNTSRSFLVDDSVTTPWMLVKESGTAGTVSACAAVGDKPIGVCFDEYDANNTDVPVTVYLLGGAQGFLPMIVGATAVTEGGDVYSDGAGNVVPRPTGATALCWRVGIAAFAEATAGNYVAVAPSPPVPVCILAAITIPTAVATTTPTNSTPYGFTAAQAAALIANLNAAWVAIAAIQSGADVPVELMFL